MYSDARANAPATETVGAVKVTGPVKRTFFSAEENQKLGIGLSQLPRHDILKQAVTQFDEKLISMA